jgi:hypothetical protein
LLHFLFVLSTLVVMQFRIMRYKGKKIVKYVKADHKNKKPRHVAENP